MAIAQRVRAQYERYPYPPTRFWALPGAAQARSVAFEHGSALVGQSRVYTDSVEGSHEGARVLVVGGGTLEPLLVAQAHPNAQEVTILDLSGRAVQRAQRRIAWWKLRHWLHKAKRPLLPPLTWVVNDLHGWSGATFDYIIASNVLHHTPDPAAALERLATWLRPGGLLRLVTYPKRSRLWLAQVRRWLQWHGLSQTTPRLNYEARRAIAQLPAEHPIRLCFETHRESATNTGIVDAFLHACERPLSPQEWGRAAAHADLVLVGEDQHALSRSDFLDQLVPACSALNVWDKLEILDCTLELSTNLVLWFVKASPPTQREERSPLPAHPPREALPRRQADSVAFQENNVAAKPVTNNNLPQPLSLLTPALSAADVWAQRPARVCIPSQLYWELGEAVRRAAHILSGVNVDIAQLMEALRAEVGTHYSADGTRLLRGFAASDYDIARLMAAPEPWSEAHWQRLDVLAQGACGVRMCGRGLPPGTLWQQVQWLQARYGTVTPAIEVGLVWSVTSRRQNSS